MALWGRSEKCGRGPWPVQPGGRATTCLDSETWSSIGVRGLILPLVSVSLNPFNYFELLSLPELVSCRDSNIYSHRRQLRQSCLCCAEDSPLWVSQLSINLEPLPLLYRIRICLAFFPLASFLFLSHLLLHTFYVINCGMKSFVLFQGFRLLLGS